MFALGCCFVCRLVFFPGLLIFNDSRLSAKRCLSPSPSHDCFVFSQGLRRSRDVCERRHGCVPRLPLRLDAVLRALGLQLGHHRQGTARRFWLLFSCVKSLKMRDRKRGYTSEVLHKHHTFPRSKISQVLVLTFDFDTNLLLPLVV